LLTTVVLTGLARFILLLANLALTARLILLLLLINGTFFLIRLVLINHRYLPTKAENSAPSCLASNVPTLDNGKFMPSNLRPSLKGKF
jgi:hypothetical protein